MTCTPARGDIGAFVLFADFDAEVIANAKAELPESVKSRHVYTSQQDGRFALVYAAKDGGALTEPFTLVFRTERGAEFDAGDGQLFRDRCGERCGARTDRYGADDGKTFTYVKEPEIGAALLSLIPPTGTLSPSFDPEMFQYSLSVPVFRHVTRFRRPACRGLRCAREPQKSSRGRRTVDFDSP